MEEEEEDEDELNKMEEGNVGEAKADNNAAETGFTAPTASEGVHGGEKHTSVPGPKFGGELRVGMKSREALRLLAAEVRALRSKVYGEQSRLRWMLEAWHPGSRYLGWTLRSGWIFRYANRR